ncbi:hypothetical protein CHS0354_024686 [Potamilus streckersoni]|uniref:Uncharacterized protein n=1 Tax=Potamilus streckersoni TaxID=2493646 RepID=A0AAE0RX02_9BIVA|nr:hypothetical protein CHS0354_024686 [Potamilus streckersoni]
MGKNKGNKSKKDAKPLRVAEGVKKNKTKPLSTNLKKINFQTKSKTDLADTKITDVRRVMLETCTVVKTNSEGKLSGKTNSKISDAQPPPDVDMTMQEFAKL